MQLRMSISLRWACLLPLVAIPFVANAQPAETSILETIALTFQNTVNAVIGTDFSDRVKDSAVGLSGGLQGLATGLAGALTLISLIWGVMLAMLEKKPVVPAAVEALLFGIIALMLIRSFVVLVDTVYGMAMGTMNAVGLNVGNTFREFIQSIASSVASVFSNISRQAEFNWRFAEVLLEGIFALLVLAIAAYFLLKSLSSIMGVFIMGPIFLGVGIVVGPVMCATVASSFTRQWFQQWLNFLVGSAFLTVTAVVVLRLLAGIFSPAFQQLGGGSTAAIALGIAMVAAGLAKLFEAIPGITDAIFPGRTGAGRAIDTRSIGSAANPVNHARAAAGGVRSAAANVRAGYGRISSLTAR